MTYRVIISERAEQHIDDIIEYITVELANPSAAKAILSDIEEAYDKLKYMAESLTYCQDPHLQNRGYRKYILASHDYVLLYTIDKNEVHISGVFHMREDYVNKL